MPHNANMDWACNDSVPYLGGSGGDLLARRRLQNLMTALCPSLSAELLPFWVPDEAGDRTDARAVWTRTLPPATE